MWNVICCRIKKGQKKPGVDCGSTALLKLIHPQVINSVTIVQESVDDRDYQQIARLMSKQLPTDHLYLILGGDHSISHATITASLQNYGRDLMVIWIDAHGDINTQTSSLSGNRHGMPLSGLMGFEPHWWGQPVLLHPPQLIYYGTRDLDKFEIDIIKHYQIKTIKQPEQIRQWITPQTCIHLSFDVDALDPRVLDSTGTLAPRGLCPNDIIHLYHICLPQLVSLDIMEFNPRLGHLARSLKTMESIINQTINVT